MKNKEEIKENLISKLLGKYANQNDMSIIKIGSGSVKEDVDKRWIKACSALRKKIKNHQDEFKTFVEKNSVLPEENYSLRMNKIELEQDVAKAKDVIEKLKTQLEETNKKLKESNDEIDIRRKEDNRFTILDL